MGVPYRSLLLFTLPFFLPASVGYFGVQPLRLVLPLAVVEHKQGVLRAGVDARDILHVSITVFSCFALLGLGLPSWHRSPPLPLLPPPSSPSPGLLRLLCLHAKS